MSTVMAPGAKMSPARRQPRGAGRAAAARRFVGGFYLVMGGINAGIVAADPQTYRTFADGSFWPWVTSAWHDVVMTAPHVWFVLLAAGEVTLGCLLLRGGRAARVGWAGVVVFHVLLMTFGFGFWLWSVPALAFLVPAARADWPYLAPRTETRTGTQTETGVDVPLRPVRVIEPSPTRRPSPASATSPLGPAASTPSVGHRSRWTLLPLAVLVVVSSLYGLLASEPYRNLPETTVIGARAQDAVSIVVALLLAVLAVPRRVGVAVRMMTLGLYAYLAYSYLIYVSGVPMNRMFLIYVAIVAVAGAGLVRGVVDVLALPPASRPSVRLRTITGWVLLATSVLFAGLWLSTLLPYALGGAAVDPQGVGGTPYPVFWLDLAIVLPAIGAVGVLLLRDRPVAPGLAVVALVKIVTLFTALWAGPLVAATTGGDVELGPDAVPSLVLLAGSVWMLARWVPAFGQGPAARPRTK